MFLVRSVYFNLRNILPKSGTFFPEHPVYVCILCCLWLLPSTLLMQHINEHELLLLLYCVFHCRSWSLLVFTCPLLLRAKVGVGGSLLERVPIEMAQNCVLVTGRNTSAGLLVSFYCRLKFCARFEVVTVELMTIWV